MDSVCRRYILGRRVGQSMVCCTGIQFTVVLAILIPLTMNAWQPGAWLRNIMDVLLYSVGYTIPLSIIFCVLCLINSEDIEGDKKLLPSRFSSLCSIFSVRNVVMGCIYTVMGSFYFYLYVSLIGGEYGKLISANCAGYECLLESHLYLILCGIWMGIIYFLKNHIFGSQIMFDFVIRQSKVRQIKSELKPLIKRAFSEAFWLTVLFAFTYYFKGDSIRDKFCEIFYLKFEDDPLSARIFSPTLIIYSWFLATIFFASLNTVKLILQVCVTDHKAFPISKSLGNPNSITLHEALCMKTLPAIQYLGYHDLMVLSAKDSKRREELFSLSQPGGHPHNWNMIIEECLQFINSFTAELTCAIGNTSTEPFYNLTKPAIVHQSTAPLSPHTHAGMRNLSIVHPAVGNLPTTGPLQEHKLVEIIGKKVNLVKEKFSKNVAINYIFGELPDSKINHAFSKSQPLIWATQSLALLAAASFHEDQYGVVQKDLPAIISALLQLKQVLEKLQKISSYKKSPRNENYNMKLRHAIRLGVKRSLYRITVTFGNHLLELPLPKDIILQVQNFIMNRE